MNMGTTTRRTTAGLIGLLLGALLAACGSETSTGATSSPGRSSGALPFGHVHGVGVDPADGAVMVATHEGLFRVDPAAQGADRVSPVMDLMGFAVVGPGHFVASGHPGPDVGLPQPVGLIESTDSGRTWRPVSREGQSDFHALTVGEAGYVGYDGSLLRSADGETWTTLAIPLPPASLAASPRSSDLLATTQRGLLRSTDGGESWESVEDAPLLQLVDWGSDGRTVVGVAPTGGVWTSDDGGATWTAGPELGSSPQAAAAGGWGIDAERIVVATQTAVLASDDLGRTFRVVAGA